jgi:hypothetical protein
VRLKVALAQNADHDGPVVRSYLQAAHITIFGQGSATLIHRHAARVRPYGVVASCLRQQLGSKIGSKHRALGSQRCDKADSALENLVDPRGFEPLTF